MINTLIVGLGNIGFKFDKKNIKKQITHASAIYFHKKFKLVGGVDKKKKILKEFSNIYNVPVFNNLRKSLSETNAQLIIFAYQPSYLLWEKYLFYSCRPWRWKRGCIASV
jgi:predicted dehydrogenase